MASTRARNSHNLKSEPATATNGITTPNSSISTGTSTPKQEEIEISFSDITQGVAGSFPSHHGLPAQYVEQDEGYHTQIPERKLRSDAPSFATSRQPSRRRESIDLTAMDELPTPGASLQIVGEKVALLVDAIEELRQLGLKELDTELPELVLIGDQSAGKSTLMGAIAEINLPKDKGMCTRCPANIKTSPADTWSCTVSLHQYYYFSSDRIRTPTKRQPFPPWKESPDGMVKIPFKTIYQKSELEDVLRWAQVAQLNPSQNPKSYIPGTGANAQRGLKPGDKHEADFSPNLVAIEISGPRLPPLSFYDLPGIFVSAAAPEEKYLVQVFENLAEKYIRHENALVICAMTMQNDPGLSRSSAIIREFKAEKRCVGVLTMPDRLQEGSTHLDYNAILHGRAHVWPRGYFVTKQPGPDFKLRQHDYHAQARQEEEDFFNSDYRWAGEWADYRDRCGTAAIQEYLSQEFANQIIRSMPNIDAKINAQAMEVDDALRSLPELPTNNYQAAVRTGLQTFSSKVQMLLSGASRSNGLLSSWSQLSNEFRGAIQTMKPKFDLRHPSDMAPQEPTFIDLVDSDDGSDEGDDEKQVEPSPLPNRNGKRPSSFFSTPRGPRQKVSNGSAIPFIRSPSTTRSMSQQSRSVKQESDSSAIILALQRRPIKLLPRVEGGGVFRPFARLGNNFLAIKDIRTIIDAHRSPGIPDHIDNAAYEDICLLSVNPWNLVLAAFIDQTFKMLRQAVLSILSNSLRDFKQTQLYRSSKDHVVKFLEMHEAEQRKALLDSYDLEANNFFTINNEAFEKYRADELRSLATARRKHRVTCYIQKKADREGKVFNETQTATEEKKVQDQDLGPDPFRTEIQTAAYVNGYYKTAGIRFVDQVGLKIRGTFFRKVEIEIMGMLEGCLGLNAGDAEQICRNLMVENPSEAKQRRELQEKKAKLMKAADSLAELVRKYTMDDPIDPPDHHYVQADVHTPGPDSRSPSPEHNSGYHSDGI